MPRSLTSTAFSKIRSTRSGATPADGSSRSRIVRLGHQRLRNREHLPLSARERPGVWRRRSRRRGKRSKISARRARASTLGNGRAPRSRFSSIVIVVKTLLALRHVADAASGDRVCGEPVDAALSAIDRALRGPKQAADRLDQRRLAGSVRSDDRDDLAGIDGQSDAVEDVDLGDVAGDEALDAQDGAAIAARSCPRPRYASITAGSRRTSCGSPARSPRPSAITTTRSAWFMTTSMSCSTKRNVTPCSSP